MVRFRLREALFVTDRRYRAGTVISDGVGALPGDAIWSGLNARTVLPSMEPLDASATSMRSAAITQRNTMEPHRKQFDQNIPCSIPGNQSVDG